MTLFFIEEKSAFNPPELFILTSAHVKPFFAVHSTNDSTTLLF